MRRARYRRGLTMAPLTWRKSAYRPASDPLRVLCWTTSFFPLIGGLEVSLERTAAHLAELCDLGLVTKRHHWFPGEKPIDHFVLPDLVGSDWKTAWQEIAAWVDDLLSRFEPDIVHFGSARSAIYRRVLPADLPSVATVHGNDLTDVRPRSEGSDDQTPRIVASLNACDHIYPVSQHTAGLARSWGVTSPATVLSPGCDLDFYQPRSTLGEQARAHYRIPDGAPMVLTVSRLVPRKGHRNVLDALAGLPFRVVWVVVGEGPSRAELEAAIADRGLSDHVLLLGNVSDDDLLALYNACDVFVLTPEERWNDGWLDSEGFGLVFHEASACGKPVISSAISGCVEAVVDGRTGLLVPPGEAEALGRAIAFVLSNPSIAEELGQNGLETVRLRGGWPRLARELMHDYRRVLERRDSDFDSTGDRDNVA